jgi:O-antigen chain-terminating methyltransferase
VDPKTEELTAIIQQIRDRVRSQHPNGSAGAIPIPDLMPLLHARDAAEGKVASIGTVNPRAPGLLNSLVQSVKRLVARALDWHVREQVEFNRAVMGCVQATIEVLNENNRALARVSALHEEARELKDIRVSWAQWRQEWERNLSSAQIQFLRSLSDLQAAWQHRVTLLDESQREQMKVMQATHEAMHARYEAALERSASDIQKRLWADLERVRDEYLALIHTELRMARQKASLSRVGATTVAAAAGLGFEQIDWLKFAERFRGCEEYVKRNAAMYVERFAQCTEVLDLGCGRGEMLETFKAAGIPARGIELNDDCLAMCRDKGLEVEKADLFSYLSDQPDKTVGGVVCSQVVEHLQPEQLPRLVALVHEKLRPRGVLAIETPNPECLAIFATHFYLDPTHTRPVPPALLDFYLEEAGFADVDVVRLEPAEASMPTLTELPDGFRQAFFGSLDYAIFGRKV